MSFSSVLWMHTRLSRLHLYRYRLSAWNNISQLVLLSSILKHLLLKIIQLDCLLEMLKSSLAPLERVKAAYIFIHLVYRVQFQVQDKNFMEAKDKILQVQSVFWRSRLVKLQNFLSGQRTEHACIVVIKKISFICEPTSCW